MCIRDSGWTVLGRDRPQEGRPEPAWHLLGTALGGTRGLGWDVPREEARLAALRGLKLCIGK
eukprot:8085631-Alexandrium_andersonii.AAC.1